MIIIAVLVLIVLVIMIFIFSGKMGDFGKQTKTCGSQGGVCYDNGGKKCPGPTFNTSDCKKCCIELYGS